MPFKTTHPRKSPLGLVLATAVVLSAGALGQSSLQESPKFERYQQVKQSRGALARDGTISRVEWSADGHTLFFSRGGERYAFDLDQRTVQPAKADESEHGEDRNRRRGRPGRGQQRDRERSPDGRWVAVCRDDNVVLESTDEGEEPRAITVEGDRKHRYGRASWVYGEELEQDSAMWWSPDSSTLAFYGLDERNVPDYPLLGGLTERRPHLLTEGYPKPGDPNPVASLFLYHVSSGQMVQVDTGPSDDAGVGHYVYDVRFSPDGRSLLFNRTNRWQNELELVAADAETGESRVVVRESQPTWQKNRPLMRFLSDGKRFIWETERAGRSQYELRSLDGTRLNALSDGAFPVAAVIDIDEEQGIVYYTAFSGENPLDAQLHRVELDGSNGLRLTREPLDHSAIDIAPNGQWFLATAEAIDVPPRTILFDREGHQVAVLAESDGSRFEELGLQPPELFSFTAADGRTELFGILYKPSDFDPDQRYPLVIDVYGGPFTRQVRNRYRPVHALCELGFLVAEIDNRGTVGRDKAFEGATYLNLGTVDLQDQVDGVRYLCGRPEVDASRVGIYGGSYGGYLAALALLKYPEMFQVAVAVSAVTDWRNYDTIYTERYMRTPEVNPEGYEQGSCLTYADQLEGKLLLLHGMIDDNVHPTNLWQLASALQKAGKPFEMMLYPDRGHSLGEPAEIRRLQFLYHHLIERESVMPAAPLPTASHPAPDADDRRVTREAPMPARGRFHTVP